VRLLVNAAAIALTIFLFPRIEVLDHSVLTYLILAAVWGLLNAFIKPLVQLITLPLLFATYGLVLIIINTLLLLLMDRLLPNLLSIPGLATAIFAGAVLGIVGALLENLLGLTRPIMESGDELGQRTRPIRLAGSFPRIRESLRLQQTYNVFMRYGGDAAFDRGLIGDFRRSMQQWIWQPAQRVVPLSMPVKVRLMLQELGPTYIKMGQIISSQADSLPAEWREELVKLQSNVPPFPVDQVHEIIEAELGASTDELYASFSPDPLAAASTAQVHRATLLDGEEVVVKVQRPDILNQVRADLDIMHSVTRWWERRDKAARSIGFSGMVDEFGKSVINELDYRGEAYNARRLARNMASIPGMHIPIVYRDLSTARVMTIEFIRGVKVTDLEAIDAAGLDRQALAETAMRGTVKQLLVDGFFHGDPHPGNVMVSLDTGMITLLDTGMVGELTVKQRMNLVNLMVVAQDHDASGMGRVLYRLSERTGEVDERAYYRDFERRVGRHMDPDQPVALNEVMNPAFDVLIEHGLRLDSQLTLALKAIMQATAISRVLFPGTNVSQMAVSMTTEMAVNELDAEKIVKVAKRELSYTLGELVERMPTLQDAALKWLDQYQRGQFALRLDTSELGKNVRDLRGIVMQATIGILLVGMIIGSAIATNAQVEAMLPWPILPNLPVLGYTVSMVVAVVFVVRLIAQLARRNGDE
jgi:ubiquinone biosynthesis protein